MQTSEDNERVIFLLFIFAPAYPAYRQAGRQQAGANMLAVHFMFPAVISVKGKEIKGLKLFRWDKDEKDFIAFKE